MKLSVVDLKYKYELTNFMILTNAPMAYNKYELNNNNYTPLFKYYFVLFYNQVSNLIDDIVVSKNYFQN